MSADLVEHRDIGNAAWWLLKFAEDRSDQPPHWISTPEGDLGQEFCGRCGHYKVRNLKRRDRKRRRDYYLDGGWRTEEEHFCECAACGKRLDVSLTDYGVSQEIYLYEECEFSNNFACIACDLSELCFAVRFWPSDTPEPNALRKLIIRFKTHLMMSGGVNLNRT